MGGRLQRRGCSWGKKEDQKTFRKKHKTMLGGLPHSIAEGKFECLFETLIDEFCTSFPFPLGLVSRSVIAFAEARSIAASYRWGQER